MPTVMIPIDASGRVALGDTILAKAKAINAPRLKKRLVLFSGAHGAYAKAHAAAEHASEKLAMQQARIAERDVDQDAAVEALAEACIEDGLPAANPFKPLGFAAPSAVQAMGYRDEAIEVKRLAAAAKKHAALSPKTKAAAAHAEKTAHAVEAEIANVPVLVKAHVAAMLARDALAQAWLTGLASLERGARAAEDDGQRGLFAKLFGATKRKKKKALQARFLAST